jgi:hypothetical protein
MARLILSWAALARPAKLNLSSALAKPTSSNTSTTSPARLRWRFAANSASALLSFDSRPSSGEKKTSACYMGALVYTDTTNHKLREWFAAYPLGFDNYGRWCDAVRMFLSLGAALERKRNGRWVHAGSGRIYELVEFVDAERTRLRGKLRIVFDGKVVKTWDLHA